MKKSKVVLGSVALLSVMTLAACGGSGDKGAKKSDVKISKTGFPIAESKLSLTMFGPSNVANYKNMAMLKAYAKMTNVDFEYTNAPDSDLATKLNLEFASGKVPGIIFASQISKIQEIQYGGNALLALDKYIDEGYAPNLKKILDKYPEVRKSMTSPDGHIYTLPSLSSKYDIDDEEYAKKAQLHRGSLWYNGQWLKKLGLSEPKTVDEFYDMLVKFRDEDPNGNGKKDEIPLTTSSGDTDKLASLRPWLLDAFGVYSQQEFFDEASGKVVYGATTDNYKAYLEFMRKLYSEKLLDNDTFSQSDDQKKAKGNKDQLGAYMDWFSFFTSGKTEEKSVEDPMAYPLSSKYNPDASMSASDGVSTGAFAVSNNNPSPEAAVRWVDYFYSSEGSQFLNAGPDEKDGGYWHLAKNDKGEEVHVVNDNVQKDKVEDTRGTVTPDYGHVVPKVGSRPLIILPELNDPVEQSTFSKFIDEQAETKVGPFEKTFWPTLHLSKQQIDELGSSMATDILTYAQQMEAKFIVGQEKLDDATWDNYLKTMNQIGVEKYIKVQQEAYDTWKNS